MSTERCVVLHCTEGNHNKYYEITIQDQPNGNGNYFVRCRWGRIEHFKDGNPQAQTKVTNVSKASAEWELDCLVKAKKKKGYKIVSDTNQIVSNSKSEDKRLKAQGADFKPFDRTEHVEVTFNWWATIESNIEERAV